MTTHSVPASICRCFPDWLKEYRELSPGMCAGCKTPIPADQGAVSQVIAYTCSLKADRVHVFNIHFHLRSDDAVGICTSRFNEAMAYNRRELLIERVPFLQCVNHGEILKKHRQTGVSCENCRTGEQVHCKFYGCSRCKQIRYCSVECQHAHYPQHRAFCKEKARGMAAVAATPPAPVELGPPCECFSERDAQIHEKASRYECSAPNCKTIVGGPIMFCVYATSCTKTKGAWHSIPEYFCSDRCRKRTLYKEGKKIM